MYGVISAGATLLIFVGLYIAGVVEARADLWRGAGWDDPARRLPRARVLRQR
jgi:hypothetical protein